MALVDAALNRLVGGEAWVGERLAAHAGRVFALRVGPLTSRLRIADDGTLGDVPLAETTPDLVLTVAPFNVAPLLADVRRWNEFVVEEGDLELGGTLKELAQTLPWFVERLSGRAFGAIVGQRVADAGRQLLGIPEYAATRVAASVAIYARDEARFLARPSEMRGFTEDVAAMALRVDALAARLAALDARATAASAASNASSADAADAHRRAGAASPAA
jgi:ubiquinone biosynthesis protein UbiJ